MCISDLYINDEQIIVGKNNDLPNFIMSSEQNICTAEQVRTSLITVKNGKVISSSCHGK